MERNFTLIKGRKEIKKNSRCFYGKPTMDEIKIPSNWKLIDKNSDIPEFETRQYDVEGVHVYLIFGIKKEEDIKAVDKPVQVYLPEYSIPSKPEDMRVDGFRLVCYRRYPDRSTRRFRRVEHVNALYLDDKGVFYMKHFYPDSQNMYECKPGRNGKKLYQRRFFCEATERFMSFEELYPGEEMFKYEREVYLSKVE